MGMMKSFGKECKLKITWLYVGVPKSSRNVCCTSAAVRLRRSTRAQYVQQPIGFILCQMCFDWLRGRWWNALTAAVIFTVCCCDMEREIIFFYGKKVHPAVILQGDLHMYLVKEHWLKQQCTNGLIVIRVGVKAPRMTNAVDALVLHHKAIQSRECAIYWTWIVV